MWSKINERKDLWERATGRPYGFETDRSLRGKYQRELDSGDYENVGYDHGRTGTVPAPKLSPRQAREHTRKSKEIEKLVQQIAKKKQDIVKLTRRKRTGDAQRAQAELDSLQKALDSRRREMAKKFS